MSDFFSALATQSFLQNAVVIALLASFACGVIGSFVVVKRISFIGGGIAHTVLAGLGIASFLGANVIAGALVAAVAAACIIGLISLYAREHEDTLISALWAVGMAIGIIFIRKTPGYATDLFSYLFGNILLATAGNVIQLLLLDALVAIFVFAFYKRFVAVCFDEEFTRLQGVRVPLWYLLLLCLTALTVVILVQVVGIILVIALLTLPPAIAGQWTQTLGRMMVVACIATAVFTLLGLSFSYSYNLPGGAVIVLTAAVSFLLSLAVRRFGKFVARLQHTDRKSVV